MEEIIENCKKKHSDFIQIRINDKYSVWVITTGTIFRFDSLEDLRNHLNE